MTIRRKTTGNTPLESVHYDATHRVLFLVNSHTVGGVVHRIAYEESPVG